MEVQVNATSVRLPIYVYGTGYDLTQIDLNDVTAAYVEISKNGVVQSQTAITLVSVSDETWAEGNIQYVSSGYHYVSVPNSMFVTPNTTVSVVIDSSSQTIVPVEAEVKYTTAINTIAI